MAGDLEMSLRCVKSAGLVSLIGFLDQGEKVGGMKGLVESILFGGKVGEFVIFIFCFALFESEFIENWR